MSHPRSTEFSPWRPKRYAPGPDDHASSRHRIENAIAAAELERFGVFTLERDPEMVFYGLSWREIHETIRRSEAAWDAFARWQGHPPTRLARHDSRGGPPEAERKSSPPPPSPTRRRARAPRGAVA